jgi:bifunctional non-homologous end joining protein LigD
VKDQLLPQLLNAVDNFQPFIDSPRWCAQEKFDGRRLVLTKEGPCITGWNRRGLVVNLPPWLRCAVHLVPGDFAFDGELVGSVYHVFDLLQLGRRDCRRFSYRARLAALADAVGTSDRLKVVSTAFTREEKEALLERLRAEGREGVVFKRLAAPYTAGRPREGGDQLKHKFWHSCSAVVAGVTDKRSVALELGGVPIGCVAIPQNHALPSAGAVVEVRYLYAYSGGGLCQPVYLGIREDIEARNCTTEQLRFRPTTPTQEVIA